MAFALESNIIRHGNTSASMRRVYRELVGKKRVFRLSEIVQGLETVMALIIAPAHPQASPQRLAETVSNRNVDEIMTFSISEACVPLLQCEDGCVVHTGSQSGPVVCVRKVHFSDGQFVFYLTAESYNVGHSPPWALGIDEAIYSRLKREACAMLRLQIQS
eukprot:7380364-Prymnesium_polylepis.1